MSIAYELPGQPEVRSSLPDRLRQWHAVHPLEGNPPNALLSVPDGLLLYVIGAVRNIPCIPPVCAHEAWDHILSCLRPHWIIPLVASHIISWPVECQPPEKILPVFERALLNGVARSLIMGHQVSQVLRAFQEAEIPVLLIKGPALARTVYPDPALRLSGDIDLLVMPDDFLRCERIMETLGYSSPARTYRLSRYAFHHQTFVPRKNRLMIEVHWMADFGFGYFPENWLENAMERKIHVHSRDLTFDTLHPQDNFQFLVFHNVIQHNRRRLDWIMDVARLTQEFSPQEDWESVQVTSVTHHIRIPVEIAVREAVLWSGHTLPATIADFSTWPAPSAREERLWQYAEVQADSERAAIRLRLQGLPGFGEKLKYCGRYVLPPPHMMTVHRRSGSWLDPRLAHMRRWGGIVRGIVTGSPDRN